MSTAMSDVEPRLRVRRFRKHHRGRRSRPQGSACDVRERPNPKMHLVRATRRDRVRPPRRSRASPRRRRRPDRTSMHASSLHEAGADQLSAADGRGGASASARHAANETATSGTIARTGLDWTGLDWTGLDWTGLVEVSLSDPFRSTRGHRRTFRETGSTRGGPKRVRLDGGHFRLAGNDRFQVSVRRAEDGVGHGRLVARSSNRLQRTPGLGSCRQLPPSQQRARETGHLAGGVGVGACRRNARRLRSPVWTARCRPRRRGRFGA
jgi:hypothetical protein